MAFKRSGVRLPLSPPNSINPNFVIIGDMFGFSVYTGRAGCAGIGKRAVEDGVPVMTETTGYDLSFRFSKNGNVPVFMPEGSD